ncbi:MAG: heme o synthase [Thermoguttaceae bacterium]|jgi:protoheme IX farnesyltransferase
MSLPTTDDRRPASAPAKPVARGGHAPIGLRVLARAYLRLLKVPLTAMVLVTTAIGYLLAAPGEIRLLGLVWTILGTGLAAGGAGALNQLLEIRRDAKMQRTRHRPLPAGELSPVGVFVLALLSALAGLAILNELVNPLTALLGLANLVIYLLIYTPLKPRTSLHTLVGAICGALPPIMGCAGASGTLGREALFLGLILFLWQIPHALAFAWLHRADCARGGFRVLPVTDPSGRLTALLIILYSLALVPVGLVGVLAPSYAVAGYLFAAVSLALGLGLFLLAVLFGAAKTDRNARRLFLASIAYLPLLLLAMLANARPKSAVESGRGPLPVSVQR